VLNCIHKNVAFYTYFRNTINANCNLHVPPLPWLFLWSLARGIEQNSKDDSQTCVMCRLLLCDCGCLAVAIGWLFFNRKISCCELAVAMVVTACHHCGRTLLLQRGITVIVMLAAWDCWLLPLPSPLLWMIVILQIKHCQLAIAIVVRSCCHWAATLSSPLGLCFHDCNAYATW